MAYRKVYIRIASSYRYDTGWPDEGAEDAFLAESRRLFQGAGWELHPGRPGSGTCDTVTKGLQELYLHPMEFSGVIREEEIPAVREILSPAECFHCQGVDCYEKYMELSDEEYLTLLGSRRDEIEAEILKHYQTRRQNLYLTGPSVENIARLFSVRRVNDRDGKHDFAGQFIENLIQQMLRDGRLVAAETRHGIGIRTATSEELNVHGLDRSPQPAADDAVVRSWPNRDPGFSPGTFHLCLEKYGRVPALSPLPKRAHTFSSHLLNRFSVDKMA